MYIKKNNVCDTTTHTTIIQNLNLVNKNFLRKLQLAVYLSNTDLEIWSWSLKLVKHNRRYHHTKFKRSCSHSLCEKANVKAEEKNCH